jgi:hypothetical protein
MAEFIPWLKAKAGNINNARNSEINPGKSVFLQKHDIIASMITSMSFIHIPLGVEQFSDKEWARRPNRRLSTVQTGSA